MTDTRATAARDLQTLCRQANLQAARWPAQAAPRAAARPAPRLAAPLKALVAAGCGLLGLAALAVQLQWVPLGAGPQAVNATTQPAVADAPLRWAEAAPPADTSSPVAWHGDVLALAFDDVPLPQAVAWLAQATGSRVSGLEALPATAVHLRFRGRDVRSAWQRLLQGQPGVALACDVSTCSVWIGAAATEGSHAGLTPNASHSPTLTPPAAAPAVPDESESQPGGSC